MKGKITNLIAVFLRKDMLLFTYDLLRILEMFPKLELTYIIIMIVIKLLMKDLFRRASLTVVKLSFNS